MQIEQKFISDIKNLLAVARQKTYTTINFVMVEVYWNIGKRIVEEEQNGNERADYGSFLLKELSKQLAGEFGKGFSEANLRNFRQFYLTFPDEQIRYTMCSKLGWSHNRLIMRIENPSARQYYLTEAINQNWSVRTLTKKH